MNTLILISGIPGSGKTTLSNSLQSDFTLHVDSLEALLHQYSYQQILEQYDQLPISNVHQIFDANIWQDSRQLAYDIIKQKLQNSKNKVFIIEDDFLLHSQRKEYRNLCWNHNSLYIEIQIQISLQEALKRNELREQIKQLSQDVLLSCYNKYELSVHANRYPYKLVNMDSEFENNIQQFIQDSIQFSIIPQIQQNTQINEIQKESIIHQTDIQLRKLISTLHKQYDAKKLSEIKKRFLKGQLSEIIEQNIAQFLESIK